MTEEQITRRLYVLSLTTLLTTAGCLGENGEDELPPPEPAPTQPNEQQGTEALVPVTQVDSLPTPVKGDPEADVTVSVYEDFACPHCRDYSLSVFPEIDDEFIEPGEIRYERYDYPIPVDERWSWAAANAARSVQNTVGVDEFWRYSHLLYENQGGYSYPLLGELGERVDADPGTVRTAAEERVYDEVLQENRERGRERGVTGTPTVFVNGRSVNSNLEDIRRAVRNELDSSD